MQPMIRAMTRSQRPAVLISIAWVAMSISSSSVADCFPEPQGEGRVDAILDGRTLRLSDGRDVRLAGIETPTGDVTTLTDLVKGRDIRLHGGSDAPDRYGRQTAWLFVDQAETSVQVQLVTQGAALAAAGSIDAGCVTELHAAEAIARREKRGVWAANVIKNTESPGDILAGIGRFTVIEGRVLSVRQAGSVTYVNFGRRWTRDFAVTIPKRALASFEAAGMVPKSLEHRRIRVRGYVERHGGPRIEASNVRQIEIIGVDDPPVSSR